MEFHYEACVRVQRACTESKEFTVQLTQASSNLLEQKKNNTIYLINLKNDFQIHSKENLQQAKWEK